MKGDRMRRLILAGLALGLVACSSKPAPAPPPQSLVMPGSRFLFNNTSESLWTICDRGARVYMSNKGGIVVVPGGCPDGNP